MVKGLQTFPKVAAFTVEKQQHIEVTTGNLEKNTRTQARYSFYRSAVFSITFRHILILATAGEQATIRIQLHSDD